MNAQTHRQLADFIWGILTARPTPTIGLDI